MALIGPRPLLPEDQPTNPLTRLMVRPGITGWAQVNGGKFLTPKEKDQYDEYYIRNASLWFDLRIIFMTLRVLFRFTAHSDHAVAAACVVGFGETEDPQSSAFIPTLRTVEAKSPLVKSSRLPLGSIQLSYRPASSKCPTERAKIVDPLRQVEAASMLKETPNKQSANASLLPETAQQHRLAVGPSEIDNTPARRWFVAQTHVHAETKATFHLARQGFEIYLPRYLKKRRHARRVDTVAAPLFPRYVFISVDMATQRWLSI